MRWLEAGEASWGAAYSLALKRASRRRASRSSSMYAWSETPTGLQDGTPFDILLGIVVIAVATMRV